MEKAGLNQKEIKARNLSSVLYLLNENENIGRKDIAELLSLTPAAVTKLCGELIEAGLISEVGEDGGSAKAGRKKIKLSLNLKSFYCVCINAEVDKVTVSLARFDGKLIESRELELTQDIEKIIDTAKKLLANTEVEKDRIVCASICVLGKVDDSSFGYWDNAEMIRLAEERLSLPVVIDNNIQAFALAEMIFAKRSSENNVLFLKWGPGIASAIARYGAILSGENSDVTEIGHYIINTNGRKCRCGRYGCLETEVSTMQILSEVDGRYTLDGIISSDDLAVRAIIDTKIDLVALALTNTATILNSDKVILFGSLFNNGYVSQKLAIQCKRYNDNFSEDTIALSELNGKITYIGPVALAAKNFFFDVKCN